MENSNHAAGTEDQLVSGVLRIAVVLAFCVLSLVARRAEACTVLTEYWPEASADLHESLLTALAMFRLPAANDFLIGLIVSKDPSAVTALSALTIHRHNPKITADVAAAVEANGTNTVRECFRKKFQAE